MNDNTISNEREPSSPTGPLQTLFEFLIMFLGMFLLSARMSPEIAFLSGAEGSNAISFESVFVGGLSMALLFMPLLLLIRYARSRFVVIWGGIAWFLIAFYIAYGRKTFPIVHEIREADVVNIFHHTLLVGVRITIVRVWVWILIAVIGGLLMMKKSCSSRINLAVWIYTAGFLFGYFLSPYNVWPNGIPPICFALFMLILSWLPGQRAAFERLFGIQLSPNPPARPLPVAKAGRVSGYFVIFLLLIGMIFFRTLGYYERMQTDLLNNGSPQYVLPLTAHNAYDDMKNHFRKGEEYPSVASAKTPTEYDNLLRLDSRLSTATREQILDTADRDDFDRYLRELNPFINAFQAGSHADYLDFPKGNFLSYLNLRETARALEIRSLISLKNGHDEDALKDISSIVRMGKLLRDQSLLVTQMIGVALRNIGTRTAWSMVAMRPNDAAFQKNMAYALDKLVTTGTVGLNYDALCKGDPGMLDVPILPNIEITVPKFRLAHYNALISQMNFDMVSIAVALQRYKIDKGSYPEKLDVLTPDYLKQVPKEPLDQSSYDYKPASNGWYELQDSAYNKLKIKAKTNALFMPPMLATDEDDN